MESKKDISNYEDIKMFLENIDLVIGMFGQQNGSLEIEGRKPNNISNPFSLKDFFDSQKFPTLVASFRIPDGRGELISLYFGVDEKITLKVRELDQKETAMYGDVVSKTFDTSSNASCLKYFYDVSTFISCRVAYEDLKREVLLSQKAYSEVEGKKETLQGTKNSLKNSRDRKEEELEEFNKNFSVYLTGDHLWEVI